MVGKQLNSDLVIAKSYLELLHGQLTIRNEQLWGTEYPVTEKEIDDIGHKLGIEMTVFSVKNNEFKRILTTIKDNTGKRALGTFLAKGEAYQAVINKNRYVGNADILGKKFITAYHPIVENNEIQYLLFCGITITEANASIKANLDKAAFMIINLSIAILIVVIILSIVSVRKFVTAPIAEMADILHDVGEGDLTVRLSLRGNSEITDFSEYFNQTLDKMSNSLRSVGNNAEIMRNIGTDLSSNMTETASSIHQIGANVDSVNKQTTLQASSVTETASTVEEIIRTIKSLNNSIETQASSVAQSSAAIEQMTANIASITQTLNKSNGVIENLASATADGRQTLINSSSVTKKIAEESGGLIEASNVIQNIASQTNLLAMNAAIEAAHAGDAGKGFAVVADEIRKLAEESAAQGKTITATLKNLGMEIESLSESAKTVEDKFNVIFMLAEQVKKMSNEITAAMQEQENGSKSVLLAIKNINTVTAEVKYGSEEMLKGGEQIGEEINKLDELTKLISNNMNEMASGAIQINNAVKEVNEIAHKNKQSIDNLVVEVNKFKV